MSKVFRDGQKWCCQDDLIDGKISEGLPGVQLTVAIEGVIREIWVRGDGKGGIKIGHEPGVKVEEYSYSYEGMD